MRVFINVNPKLAIRAGFDLVGKQIVDVNPMGLTPRQREELAEQEYKPRHKAICLGSGFAESLGLTGPEAGVAKDAAKEIAGAVVDASPAGIGAALDQLADLRDNAKRALANAPRVTVPLTVADAMAQAALN